MQFNVTLLALEEMGLAYCALFHYSIQYFASRRGAKYCDHQRVCVSVCLFVCPLAYLENHTSNFHEIFYRPGHYLCMAVARSSSDGMQ